MAYRSCLQQKCALSNVYNSTHMSEYMPEVEYILNPDASHVIQRFVNFEFVLHLVLLIYGKMWLTRIICRCFKKCALALLVDLSEMTFCGNYHTRPFLCCSCAHLHLQCAEENQIFELSFVAYNFHNQASNIEFCDDKSC